MTKVIQNKTNFNKISEDSANNIHQLFKPLVLNQRLMRRSETDITTMTNSSIPLSVNNDSNIPLIYPQFQFDSLSGLKSSSQLHSFIYQENQNKKLLDIKIQPCCNCNKTKCIKKYCECFSNIIKIYLIHLLLSKRMITNYIFINLSFCNLFPPFLEFLKINKRIGD